MDFKQVKPSMDKIYSRYANKISGMTQFSNAQELLKLEVVEVNNQLERIRIDLKQMVEDDLLRLYKMDQVNEMTKDMFPPIQVSQLHVDESEVIKIIQSQAEEIPAATPQVQNKAKGFAKGTITPIGAVSGVLVGAAIGKVASVGVVTGAVAGAVAGGIGGMGVSMLMPHEEPVASYTPMVERRFDNYAFERIMNQRKIDVEGSVCAYINRVEARYNSLSWGA
ncbi:MAG: hypothetical protein BEN18_04125 [Epulopiscium sp. Nuni2H_MBin001]|nr:MAG: hypothetical protein BEN18_04125 [Epulopiscium sp. Nuni2H_MBin001]